MRRFCTISAVALFATMSVGPVAAATMVSTKSGVFQTQGQNMWGPAGGISIQKDIYAVRTGVLPERTIGEFKNVRNPARDIFDESLSTCQSVAADVGAPSLDCTKVTVPGFGPPPPAPTPPSPPSFPRPPALSNPFSSENRAWQAYDLAKGVYLTKLGTYNLTKLPAYNATILGCQTATGATRSECQNGFQPLGNAPPETLLDGAKLTISDAELELGVRARLDVADGSVDASQGFTVQLDVPDGEFSEGDEIVIGTDGELGDATLASQFEVIDAGLDALTKLTTNVNVTQKVSGVEAFNEDIVTIDVEEPDGSAKATEILGLTIGDGGIEGRLFGESGFIDLTEGLTKQLRVPVIEDPDDRTNPLEELLGFSVADVTGYVPDLDLDEISGPTPLVGDITPEMRSGSGETPIDFLKTDLDMDVITAFNGAPLGVGGGIPLTIDVQVDLGDADLGGFFGITQRQTFAGGEIEVLLNFSVPTEVETAPGSGTYELVTQKLIKVGQNVSIRHPGADLAVTPEYRLVDSIYGNLTEAVFSKVFSAQLLNFELNGAIPTALGISGFTLFEETFPLGDPEPFATLFDGTFGLAGFNTVSGESFLLSTSTASALTPPPIPLPAAGWLMLAGLVPLLGVGHWRRRALPQSRRRA